MKSAGHILLSVLIISAILSLIAGGISASISSLADTRKTEIESLRLRTELAEQLRSEEQSAAGFSCKETSATGYGLTSKISRCGFVWKETDSPDRRFNLATFLSQAAACAKQTGPSSVSTQSAISDFTCSDTELAAGALAFSGNLVVKKAVTITANDTTLAASGAISFTDALNVTGSLLIVAGGDLQIAKITTSEKTKLTLLSLSGVVVVNHADAGVEVQAFGRQGISIPIEAKATGSGEVAGVFTEYPVSIQ